MTMGVFLRAAFFGAAAIAIFLMRPLAASAADERCPASAVAFLSREPLAVHTFRIAAKKHLHVAGEVAIDTDRGWFRMAFQREGLWDVRFARPVKILNTWVENAGGARCYAVLPDESGHLLDTQPPPGARATIGAELREPYGRADCASPFESVRANNIVLPDFPPASATFPGTVQIDVTVMPDGKVADARIVEHTSTPAFDDAAIDAARKSTYTPAVAYCLPTVAQYLYRATLRP
jgi:TonB family protein